MTIETHNFESTQSTHERTYSNN